MSRKIILQTILISIMFFLTLLLVGYVFAKVSGENEFRLNPIHIFIALVPFAVLLIVSGKLKEIRGPGGIALSMMDEIQKPISMEYKDEQIEVNPEIVQPKDSVEYLRARIADNPPTTLSFQVGRRGYYRQWAIEEYIEELRRYPSFRHILFTDEDGNFLGYMNLDDYARLLYGEHDVVSDLESGRILQRKGVKKDSIGRAFTNKQALDSMERKGVNELAVVDESSKFVGIITQEEIVRKILTRIIREI